MTTILSDSDAATRIISLWKGFKVRKIFSKMDTVQSWDVFDERRELFDEIISKSPAHARFVLAWEAALEKTDHRLWKSENGCYCQNLCGGCPENFNWSYPDQEDDSEPTDWMWNDGGGYCDW